MSTESSKRSYDEIAPSTNKYKRRLRKKKPVKYNYDDIDDETYIEIMEAHERKMMKEQMDAEKATHVDDDVVDEYGDVQANTCEGDDFMTCPGCSKDVVFGNFSCDGCGHIFKLTKDGYLVDNFIEEDSASIDQDVSDDDDEVEFEFQDDDDTASEVSSSEYYSKVDDDGESDPEYVPK